MHCKYSSISSPGFGLTKPNYIHQILSFLGNRSKQNVVHLLVGAGNAGNASPSVSLQVVISSDLIR